jgi:Glycine rich protein/HYR domain
MVTGAGVTAAMAVALPGAASAASAAGAAPAALPANCSLSGPTVTCTFGYTGGEQTFTVPSGTTSVQVTAIGAAGGGDYANADPGGEGAQVTGTLTGLSGGQTLYVEVGQAPDTATTAEGTRPAAFNGGGAPGYGGAAGGGGGASDVRTISSADAGSLASRLIVAGGGGGHAETIEAAPEPPANAGQNAPPATATGSTGQGGFAGTQTAGGAGGQGAPDEPGASGTAGSLGQGGNGAAGSPSSGGGGGGYYGGGGGGAGGSAGPPPMPGIAGGGGGGSSLVPAGGSLSLTTSPASVTISYTALELSIATHPDITTDATSPAGAVVTYTAPAVTDQANPAHPPAAVCSPPSGSTFPIGTTTVTCTATDAADVNSPVSTTFPVTVIGAAGQLAALYQAVQGFGPGLANTVLIAERAVAAGDTGQACLALDAFVIEVATHIPPLPLATVALLGADAARIQAVLGC